MSYIDRLLASARGVGPSLEPRVTPLFAPLAAEGPVDPPWPVPAPPASPTTAVPALADPHTLQQAPPPAPRRNQHVTAEPPETATALPPRTETPPRYLEPARHAPIQARTTPAQLDAPRLSPPQLTAPQLDAPRRSAAAHDRHAPREPLPAAAPSPLDPAPAATRTVETITRRHTEVVRTPLPSARRDRTARSQAAPPAVELADDPHVVITIGRIDVHVSPPTTPARATVPPIASLEQLLRGRSPGGPR